MTARSSSRISERFVKNMDIGTMKVDGTAMVNVTNSAMQEWTPDLEPVIAGRRGCGISSETSSFGWVSFSPASYDLLSRLALVLDRSAVGSNLLRQGEGMPPCP